MNLHPIILTSILITPVLFACNSAEPTPGDSTPQTQQTLVLGGNCTFAACGVVPSSLGAEPKVTCEPMTDTNCAWSGSSNDDSMSYRSCADSECPSKPAVNCPTGTAFASQVCGSENEQPCAWTTTCVPPRETTPCPEQTGCNNLPLIDIGVICRDGTAGGFACVTDGAKCFWERNCD